MIATRSLRGWSTRERYLSRWIHSTSLAREQQSSNISSPVRTRFAPSPTGSMHIGGLRTALYNHLLARKTQGKWFLRIEDTDRSRGKEGSLASIIDALKWAKLNYDEGPDNGGEYGPYTQSERLELYQRHVKQLLETRKAYRCFCSSDRLDEMKSKLKAAGSLDIYDRHCLDLDENEVHAKVQNGDPHVIRFKSERSTINYIDMVYGTREDRNQERQDFILLRSDGMPTYHFASVVDDHTMAVTHVLRGEEWLPWTGRHVMLYEAFGWTPPKFCHLPNIVMPDGRKVSKRVSDHANVEQFLDEGYEPEAVLNWLALMGWSMSHNRPQHGEKGSDSHPSSSDNEVDVLTMDSLIRNFSIEGINRRRPVNYPGKLKYLNQQHLKLKCQTREGILELAKGLTPLLKDRFPDSPRWNDNSGEEYVADVILLSLSRISTLKQIITFCPYLFVDPDLTTVGAERLKKSVAAEEYELCIGQATKIFEELEPKEWTPDGIRNALSSISTACGFKKTKQTMSPIRHAVTGQGVGPPLAETLPILGKDVVVQRLARKRKT